MNKINNLNFAITRLMALFAVVFATTFSTNAKHISVASAIRPNADCQALTNCLDETQYAIVINAVARDHYALMGYQSQQAALDAFDQHQWRIEMLECAVENGVITVHLNLLIKQNGVWVQVNHVGVPVIVVEDNAL